MLLGVIHHIESIVGITGLECCGFRHQTMFLVFFLIIILIGLQLNSQSFLYIVTTYSLRQINSFCSLLM